MLGEAARHPIHGPTFRELGQNLYYNDRTSTFPFIIIEPERCGEAAPLADLFYSHFLDKYRYRGVNETKCCELRSSPIVWKS